MVSNFVEVRLKGVTVKVPAVAVNDRTLIVVGKWLKLAKVKDEELVEGATIPDPALAISETKKQRFKADILTFPQVTYGAPPVYKYPFEWDNVAVISTSSFDDWWKRLPQEARKNARRSAKRGVSVRLAEFNDEFVRGIKQIYDESPVRQGMRFWHFGKDLETVKMENATYLERSEFIGAYLGRELIGFIKVVYVDRAAVIMQILSKSSHYDKRPMNALIAKAVEVCQDKGMSYLVYSKFTFGNKKNNQLTEFKRRNGFQQKDFVRYFVPLNLKGRIALALKLHRGLLGILPARVIKVLGQVRARSLALAQTISPRPSSMTSPSAQAKVGNSTGIIAGG